MSFGISVTCEGRLGAAPEMRYLPTGVAVTTGRLAVDNGSKKSGEKLPPTWVEITAWESLAESVNADFGKGDLVKVEGKLTVRTYTGRDGQERTVVGVRASSIDLVFARRGGVEPDDDGIPF